MLIRTILTLIIAHALLAGSQGLPPSPSEPEPAWTSRVDPWVLQTAASSETEFLVFLDEQADLSPAEHLPTKLEKGQYVYEQLSSLAERTQAPLLAELERRGIPHQSFWVANMIWVRGDQETVAWLAARPEVAHLYANPHVQLDEPARNESLQSGLLSPESVEWNIARVRAPQVWEAGYTGQGAVIGGQDTGYKWDHPALINQYRGYNSGFANHNYSWHDAIHSGGGICGADSLQPCDDYGHGTHTMGTMVGDDGGSNQIGMAPGARWIGCRNMDGGNGTPATYSECYQWFIAPTNLNNQEPRPDLAPDVINNSWGCPASEGCTDPDVLLGVVDAVRAAGILSVHSAGNSGPSCSTIHDPAAIYASSFTVGATDSADNIAGFSSRGPVTVDDSNRLKPDISAPGVNIRSSLRDGGYGLNQGTSMAAPHVAGLAALLISARPGLAGEVEELETLIERAAIPRTTTVECPEGIPGTSVPNNFYGWGRIDAYQALYLIVGKLAVPSLVLPGETITYTLAVTNTHSSLPLLNVVLTDTLPSGTEFVSASGLYSLVSDSVSWDFSQIAAASSQSVRLVVQVEPGEGETITNQLYSAAAEGVEPIQGKSVLTPIADHWMVFPLLRSP